MAEPTGPHFHPFPRLPRELRWQIWELSVAPRQVVIAGPGQYLCHGRRASPPPPLLLASGESRSYCQKFYTKAYVLDRSNNNNNAPEVLKYSWINFDLDEVYMRDVDFEVFSAVPFVQRLTLVTSDGYFIHHLPFIDLHKMAEKTLKILDPKGRPIDESWWDFIVGRWC